MGVWHYRRELHRIANEVLGDPPGAEAFYRRIEEEVDALWEMGQRDFSWYSHKMYAYSCVECFCDFAKGYAQNTAAWLNKQVQAPDTKLGKALKGATIVDVGCGIGASTILMQELMPWAKVYGQFYGIGNKQEIVFDVLRRATNSAVRGVNGSELYLSEFFAHRAHVMTFFDVIEHYDAPMKVIDALDKTGVFVISEASSFGEACYGHFPEYEIDDARYPRGRATSAAFTKAMRSRGWESQETGFWNGRPRIWVRL